MATGFPVAAIVPTFCVLAVWLAVELRPVAAAAATRRIDATAAYTFAILGWPTAFACLRSEFIPLRGTLGMLVEFAPGVVLGVVQGLRCVRQSRLVNPGPVLVWFGVVLVAVHGALGHQSVVWSALWLLTTLPVLFLDWGNQPSLTRTAALSLLAAWFATLLVMVSDPRAISACRADKCSVFGKFLTPGGALNNEIGMIMAPLLPLTAVGLRPAKAIRVGIPVLLLVDLSGSRSATFMAAVGLVLALLSHATGRIRDLALAVAMTGIIAGTLVPVVLSFPEDAFTLRGSLWIRAKELIRERPVFGSGPSFWVRQLETNTFGANYAPHNVWLELLVTGGFATLGLLVAGTSLAILRQQPAPRAVTLALLATLLSAGMTEAPIMPYRFAFPPGTFIAVLLVSSLPPDRVGAPRLRDASTRHAPDRPDRTADVGSAPSLSAAAATVS